MHKPFTLYIILTALGVAPTVQAQTPQGSAARTATLTYTNTAGVPTATAVVTYSGPETSTLTNTFTNTLPNTSTLTNTFTNTLTNTFTNTLPAPLQPQRQPANPGQPQTPPRLSPGDMNTNQPIPPAGSPTTNTNPMNPKR